MISSAAWKTLRVLALSSAEQYQEHQKPDHELARELHVGYLLSASGQVLGNQIRLILQLMDEDANTIWSSPYDRQISRVQDHIEIQCYIAHNLAQQIGVIISPVKQQLLEKVPTTNLTAYDLILKAQKYFNQYTLTQDRDYLERVNQLCKLALDLDPDLPEAYAERGIYYLEKAQIPQAIDDLKKAIKLSPNNLTACLNSGYVYYYSRDYINALINLRKAETLIRSDEMLIPLYRDLFFLYVSAGDWEKTESAVKKLIHIHPQYGLVASMFVLTANGKYPELLQAAEDCIQTMLQYGEPDVNTAHRVGIIFWMNGKRDLAMEYFNLQIDYCMESIGSNDPYGHLNAAYDLAGVYAFLGKKEEAIRWLREYERLGFTSGMQEYIKTDLLFDKLKSDEAFREIAYCTCSTCGA
jgi:tetratricopeptide (TPR) repeat protein